jgi:hypothetical protein
MSITTITTGPLSHLVSLSSHIVNVQNFERFNGVYRPQVTPDSEAAYSMENNYAKHAFQCNQ